MSREHLQPHAGGFLITAAAFVIVVAGIQEAREILVPFLLSGFIAIIAAPALFYLTERRIPTVVALLLVIGVIVAVGVLLGILVGDSVDDFSAQLPTYQERLNSQTGALLEWLAEYGISISQQAASKLVDPGKAMKMAAAGLTSLGSLLTNTFLILLTVIFILLEASSFPHKLKQVMSDPDKGLRSLDHFLETIKRYMAIKTLTSLATGALIAIWLSIVGVDYPLLWGVLAFLLNYVPNIGSLLAAVPALLLALIQLGISGTLWALLGYVVINNLIGAVIEPRFMGRGLGLSTLVVFLSLVFWGWVLGPVGMFLSVPLTMMVKIGLDSNEQTRWVAILLGSEKNSVAE